MTLNITTPRADYTFTLYPVDTRFNRISGIYTFLIIPQHIPHSSAVISQYSLLYLGITNNLRTRFIQHHKIAQAISLGMTHIAVLKMNSGKKRKKIEREILRHLNPPLNQTWVHHYF